MSQGVVESQMSQLTDPGDSQNREQADFNTTNDWETYSQQLTNSSVQELFQTLNQENASKQTKQELENILTSAASNEKLEENNDNVTDNSVATSITNATNDPENMQHLNHISLDLIGFMQTRDTIREYADYFTNVKNTTTQVMETIFKKIKENTDLSASVTNNAANTLGHVGKFLDSLFPRPGLDISSLQQQLDSKINQQMQDKNAQFTNIRAYIDTILQETATEAIINETVSNAQIFITEINNYETSMNKLMNLYQTKELSNENKMKILSLWNQLLSLNELIKNYKESNSHFSIREFDVIIEYFQDLNLQINRMNSEFESFPDKTSTAEPSPKKRGFLAAFGIGGKKTKQTKRANKQSKKNKLKKGGKSIKTKKNRRTKRKYV